LGKAIRVPLRCIKDLSEATLTRWRAELAQTPFTSVSDFCARVRPEGPEALNLIRAGAFDRLGSNRTEQFWRCLHASQDASAGAGWLFQGATEADIRATFREEPTALQKLQDELELFGYTISGHPLDCHPQIAWSTYCPIADLHRYPNQRVTVCGLIIVSRSHLQQNGQPMKFISICDHTGIVECEIFAAAYRLYGLNTVRYPVVQVTGEVKPFDNKSGYTLEVLRVQQPRVDGFEYLSLECALQSIDNKQRAACYAVRVRIGHRPAFSAASSSRAVRAPHGAAVGAAQFARPRWEHACPAGALAPGGARAAPRDTACSRARDERALRNGHHGRAAGGDDDGYEYLALVGSRRGGLNRIRGWQRRDSLA
jgi:DNA polymerase III alpha subunit